MGSLSCIVGIASRLRVECSRDRNQTVAPFLSLPLVQTASGAHPASYWICENIQSLVKLTTGVTDPSPRAYAKFQNERSCNSHHPTCHHKRTGKASDLILCLDCVSSSDLTIDCLISSCAFSTIWFKVLMCISYDTRPSRRRHTCKPYFHSSKWVYGPRTFWSRLAMNKTNVWKYESLSNVRHLFCWIH